jgi:hypothetical protein
VLENQATFRAESGCGRLNTDPTTNRRQPVMIGLLGTPTSKLISIHASSSQPKMNLLHGQARALLRPTPRKASDDDDGEGDDVNGSAQSSKPLPPLEKIFSRSSMTSLPSPATGSRFLADRPRNGSPTETLMSSI